jgi:hypothetical protein
MMMVGRASSGQRVWGRLSLLQWKVAAAGVQSRSNPLAGTCRSERTRTRPSLTDNLLSTFQTYEFGFHGLLVPVFAGQPQEMPPARSHLATPRAGPEFGEAAAAARRRGAAGILPARHAARRGCAAAAQGGTRGWRPRIGERTGSLRERAGNQLAGARGRADKCARNEEDKTSSAQHTRTMAVAATVARGVCVWCK